MPVANFKITRTKTIKLMYQSIPSLTIPPGKPPGKFLKGQNSHPPGTKKVQNPDPWGGKIVLKPHPRYNYFQKSSKENHKTLDRNYEEQYRNADMFRDIVKHKNAQSFLVDGFYGYSKCLKSFLIHLYKPTQEIHDKQVPKYDF